MKKTISGILLAVSILLTGCGGPGSEGSSDNGSTSNLYVRVLGILGNTVPAQDGFAQIDPSINNGYFQIDWSVSEDVLYTATIFVSDDAVLDTSEDTQIQSFNCGAGGIFPCDQSGRVDCRYTTDNRLGCGTTATFNLVNISSHLQALPARRYIILRVCDALATSCKSTDIPVTFL